MPWLLRGPCVCSGLSGGGVSHVVAIPTRKIEANRQTSSNLKIASSTLQTIAVRPRRLNRFGSVVWGAFAAGVTPVIRDLGRLEERL